MRGFATTNAPAATGLSVEAWLSAVALRLRSILAVAFAGAVAGVLVGGLGGRVVMRVAALLNPGAVGAVTENGNVIGEITLGGTLALVAFGGLFIGLVGSILFITIGPWLPSRGVRRAAAAAVAAVALGGTFAIDAANTDFLLLGADVAIIALLLGVVAGYGFATSVVSERFEQRLPRPGSDPRLYVLQAGALVLLGSVLFLPVTVGLYASERACLCGLSPERYGLPLVVPLIVAGIATLIAWRQIGSGRDQPSRAVRMVGRFSTTAAIVLGAIILGAEVEAILT